MGCWTALTFKKIAEVLGAPLNTMAVRYRYALQSRRTKLESEDVVCRMN